MKYIITPIEDKLRELTSTHEKIRYLKDYRFNIKKEIAEFEAFDKNDLDRIRSITQGDWEKYYTEFDNGGLIYFNEDDERNAQTYARLHFENIPLLKKRLSLETRIKRLQSLVILIDALIERTGEDPKSTQLEIPKNITKKTAAPKQIPAFKNDDYKIKLTSSLKPFFSGQESDLDSALDGKPISTPLIFNFNQNKLVEVFKRMNYNGFILNNKQEICDFLCRSFCYVNVKAGQSEPKAFNRTSVYEGLTKISREVSKKERIVNEDWLPYRKA